jgi:hypothetical protein
MTNLQESEITFPIAGGIFGVGPLATSLKALTEAGKIGPWHIGHWIDFRHTAIRIQFASSADGELVRSFVENRDRARAPAGGRLSNTARVRSDARRQFGTVVSPGR